MFSGMTRFMDFQRNLGIASNILAKRLGEFVEAGIFELRPDADGGRAEYVLTRKGRDLQPVIVALTEWGDSWAPPEDRSVFYEHVGCGGRVMLKMECERCGETRPAADAEVRRGRRLPDPRRTRAGTEDRPA